MVGVYMRMYRLCGLNSLMVNSVFKSTKRKTYLKSE